MQVLEGYQRFRPDAASMHQPAKVAERLFGGGFAGRPIVDAGGNADELQSARWRDAVILAAMPSIGETRDLSGDLRNDVTEEKPVETCYVGAGIKGGDYRLRRNALWQSIASLRIPCDESASNQAAQLSIQIVERGLRDIGKFGNGKD